MDDNQSKTKLTCCGVNTMCGRSLRQGVFYISVSALVAYFISLLLASASVLQLLSTSVHWAGQPLLALDFVFGLVAGSLSVYQLIISAFLLWHALRRRSTIFPCSVWYISHLSILSIYFLLFAARIVLLFVMRQYFYAVLTLFVAAMYEGTFIYFTVVVNSYIHMKNGTSC